MLVQYSYKLIQRHRREAHTYLTCVCDLLFLCYVVMLNFKYTYILVHTGTYWYILERVMPILTFAGDVLFRRYVVMFDLTTFPGPITIGIAKRNPNYKVLLP